MRVLRMPPIRDGSAFRLLLSKRIGQAILAILFSAIVTYSYVSVASIDSHSLIRSLAAFELSPWFGLRFLLPSTIAWLLPPEIYDTHTFRFVFAFFSIVLCFVMIEPYGRRLLNDKQDPSAIYLALFIILLCHYCLSRRLNIYQVNDFPAILFYMIAFLLLSSKSRRCVISGVFLTILFSLNRETVVIAPLHAAAFVVVRNWTKGRQSLALELAPILGTLLVIVLMRTALAYSIFRTDLFGTVSADAYGTPRILYNFRRVIGDRDYAFQLLLFGAGALIWLPFFVRTMNNQQKLLLLFSAPAFLMLCWVGNFTELRIYNEFVPLLSVLLSQISVYRTRP